MRKISVLSIPSPFLLIPTYIHIPIISVSDPTLLVQTLYGHPYHSHRQCTCCCSRDVSVAFPSSSIKTIQCTVCEISSWLSHYLFVQCKLLSGLHQLMALKFVFPCWSQIKETESKMAAANSFTVFAGNRLLVVAASSEMEKNKWMEDLQAVIEHPSNRLETDQLRYGSLKSNSESRLPSQNTQLTELCTTYYLHLQWFDASGWATGRYPFSKNICCTSPRGDLR